MEDRTIIILRAKRCLSCEPGGVCWTGGWSNSCLCCIRGANGQGWRIWNPGLFGASALEIELSTWNSPPSSVTQFCCPDFSCERSPKQTVQPVSWSWFFSTGNWGLFCEGNWRLLLQCYGIPCTQVLCWSWFIGEKWGIFSQTPVGGCTIYDAFLEAQQFLNFPLIGLLYQGRKEQGLLAWCDQSYCASVVFSANCSRIFKECIMLFAWGTVMPDDEGMFCCINEVTTFCFA